MITVLLLLAAFGLGLLIGAAVAARNAHRIVARLPEPERREFARKVVRAAHR